MAENITTTSLSDAMKIVWAPKQKTQFNNAAFWLSKVKAMTGQKWQLGGRLFEGSVKKTGGGSWRSMPESGGLPPPGSPTYDLFHVYTKTWAARYRISVQAMEASRGNEKAFVDGKMDAANMLVEQSALRLSQTLYGLGTGAIARVKNIVGDIITVEPSMGASAGDTFGVTRIEEGMYLSASANLVGNVAEKTFEGYVTDVDDSDPLNPKFTKSGPNGDLAIGDWLFIGQRLKTSKNHDWMGILGLSDDGTSLAILEDIDRTATGGRFWRGDRTDSVGLADLENHYQTKADNIKRKSNQSIGFIVTTYGVRRRFANDMKGDRRFVQAAADGKYKGGFSALSWDGPDNKPIDIWVDKDCPAGTSFEGVWDALHMSWLREPGWWDVGGGVLQRVDDTLAVEATYFGMGNFAADQVNCLGQSRDITED